MSAITKFEFSNKDGKVETTFTREEAEQIVRETADIPARVSLSDNALHQMFGEVMFQTAGVKGADVVLRFKCIEAGGVPLRFHPHAEDRILTLRDLFPDRETDNNAFVSQWVLDDMTARRLEREAEAEAEEEDPQGMD